MLLGLPARNVNPSGDKSLFFVTFVQVKLLVIKAGKPFQQVFSHCAGGPFQARLNSAPDIKPSAFPFVIPVYTGIHVHPSSGFLLPQE